MDKKGIVSDSASTAGAVFRGMSRSDRRHDRDRRMIQLAVAALAVVWVIGFSQFVWGTALNGLLVVAAAAIIGTALSFIYVLRGSAATTIAGLASAAVTAWLGWSAGMNWGFLIASVLLALVLVLGAATGRTKKLPRLLAATVAASIPPTVFLTSKLIGGWALIVAALIGGAFVAWQIDLPRRSAVRAASRRSSIPMLDSSPFSLATLGVSPPTGVDRQTLLDRVAANEATARALAKLPAGWFVFHSRVTGTGDVVDHIVVGPAGVVALRSERIPGEVRLDPVNVTDAGVPVTADEEEVGFVISEVLCETAATIDLHLMTPNQRRVTRAVMVAHEATLDGAALTQPVQVADGVRDQVDWTTPATINDYLTALPSMQWKGQFIADLAVVVDFQLPPTD